MAEPHVQTDIVQLVKHLDNGCTQENAERRQEEAERRREEEERTRERDDRPT